MNFFWYPDIENVASLDTNKGFKVRQSYIIDVFGDALPDKRGSFVIRLPMHMLFGLVENFYALRGYGIEVELNLGPDYPALFRDVNIDEGEIKFTDFKLNITVIEPSNAQLLDSLKGLKDPTSFLYSLRQPDTTIK